MTWMQVEKVIFFPDCNLQLTASQLRTWAVEKPFADSGDNRTSRQKPAMLLSSDMPTDKSIPDARRCLCYDTSESAISEHPRTGVSQCQRRHNSRPRCTFRGRGKRLAGCPPVLPPELQARPSSRPLSVPSAREPPAFSAARVSAGFDHSYGGNTHVQDIRPETSSDSARKTALWKLQPICLRKQKSHRRCRLLLKKVYI